MNAPHVLARIRREHRLLAILRSLDGDHGRTSNAEVMTSYLSAIGLACSRLTLDEELSDLAEMALVSLKRSDGLAVFGITREGCDVATGASSRDGVAMPAVDCPYL